MRPSWTPLGLSKFDCQAGKACRPLSSDPSYPSEYTAVYRMKIWIIPFRIPGSLHHDDAVLLGSEAKLTPVMMFRRLRNNKVGEMGVDEHRERKAPYISLIGIVGRGISGEVVGPTLAGGVTNETENSNAKRHPFPKTSQCGSRFGPQEKESKR
jgi:hypothetical protein